MFFDKKRFFNSQEDFIKFTESAGSRKFYLPKHYAHYMMLGGILILMSVYFLFSKSIAPDLIGMGAGFILFYLAHLNMKTLKDLKPYAPKGEINKYRFIEVGLIVLGVLFIALPKYMNLYLSLLIGIYILYNEIINYFEYKKNMRSFGAFNIIKILFAIAIIASPFMLARITLQIISLVMGLIGVFLFYKGMQIKKYMN